MESPNSQSNHEKAKKMEVSHFLISSESESASCSVVSDSLWSHGLHSPWNSTGQNTGVGTLFLLQGIFPTQGSNPCLPHCRQILYQQSHNGSPTRELKDHLVQPTHLSGWEKWASDLKHTVTKLQLESSSQVSKLSTAPYHPATVCYLFTLSGKSNFIF